MDPNDTTLVLNVGDNDPDDSYSVLAYEKGFTLLLYLERLVGTPQFEQFFQAYVARFAYQTVTSNDFKAFFVQHFHGNDQIKEVDWDDWFYSPGMPPVLPPLDQSMAHDSQHLAKLWIMVDRNEEPPPLTNEMSSWSSSQITCFLDALQIAVGDHPLQLITLRSMNDLYGLANSQNSEILFRYCELAIAAEDTTILPVVIRFITSQGRMKFVRPLYKALFRSTMGKDIAVSTFLDHRDFYHPIATKMIATDLLVDRKKNKTVPNRWIIGGILVGVVGIGLALTRGKRR